MPKNSRRTDLELANDRHQLAQLALTNPGASSTELALMFQERYGREVSPRTVRYDLQQLKKQWVVESKEKMELVRAEELNRINALEQEAWQAWRASMQPMEKVVIERLHKAINEAARSKMAGELASELADKNEYVTQEVLEAIIRDAIADSLDSGEDAETFVNKITTTTEVRVGDPRYLSMIHDIQRERRKILGVYAPERYMHDVRKIELKGYAGGWAPDDWSGSEEDNVVDGDFEEADKERAEKLLTGGDEEE